LKNHGWFWHGCPKHCKISVGNRAFWKKKFEANKGRDRRVNRELRKLAGVSCGFGNTILPSGRPFVFGGFGSLSEKRFTLSVFADN